MHNAGVICVIVGIAPKKLNKKKIIFEDDLVRSAEHINAYLISGADIYVESVSRPISASLARLVTGSVPNDEGNLIFSQIERDEVISEAHSTRDMFASSKGHKIT